MRFVQNSLRNILAIETWIRILALISILGTMLLLEQTCTLIGAPGKCCSIILLADVVILPSLYLADSMSCGIQQQHLLLAGSLLDANHAVLWTALSAFPVRFIAAWAARAVVNAGGQNGYALMQLAS